MDDGDVAVVNDVYVDAAYIDWSDVDAGYAVYILLLPLLVLVVIVDFYIVQSRF